MSVFQNLSIADQQSLDRPVWSALMTQHKLLAVGNSLACRYPSDISPFAAIADQTSTSFDALRAIIQVHGDVVLFSLNSISSPPGLQMESVGDIQQMVAKDVVVSPSPDARIIRLQDKDAPDMLELTSLTKPGPFAIHTHTLGEYIGIREEGQLVAMVGERMQFDGYVEMSAVCVHPDHRGSGYARILMTELMHRIIRRGKSPFLHVFESNRGAIALYEQLGFVRRQCFVVIRLSAADQATL